ncbi:MAG: late competence development ComFB family protein [Synechococcales bacterium]|nr:late competence development ComFB family protein [Synechococcales bacterium]
MTTKVVNITQRVVNREVERVLGQYPHRPYRQAFAHPELRRELVAYVLNRVENRYITVHPGQDDQLIDARSHQLALQQPQIEQLIHQGIQKLIRSNAEWVRSHIPPKSDGSQRDGEPSHWFG